MDQLSVKKGLNKVVQAEAVMPYIVNLMCLDECTRCKA